MNGRRVPWHLRILWAVMVRAEKIATWCRLRWVKWHETGGVILPTDDDITPPTPPRSL